MLDTKQNLRKINLIYCIIVVIACCLYAFQVKWNDTIIINSMPLVSNSLLTPIINSISSMVGNETIVNLLFSILTYILMYYLFVVFPISLWHFVRGFLK